jgi:hypothetical protein
MFCETRGLCSIAEKLKAAWPLICIRCRLKGGFVMTRIKFGAPPRKLAITLDPQRGLLPRRPAHPE